METSKTTVTTYDKNIAFYGSLRKGMYNFDRFQSRFPGCLDNYRGTVELSGFKLFTLGAYPAAVKSSNNEDKIIVDLFTIKDANASSYIDMMERGAGYKQITIKINGENFGIYVFEVEPSETLRVASGDWVKYLDKNESE